MLGFADESGAEFLKSVGRCEWVGGDKNADRWMNYPILHMNSFVFDAEAQLPETCKAIKRAQAKGVIFEIAGLCVLTKGSLDLHTDTVGPSNGSMAMNLLLRGFGSLSIQNGDSLCTK